MEEAAGEKSAKLLRLSEALISDSGQYICAAENDFGRAHLFAFLTVKGMITMFYFLTIRGPLLCGSLFLFCFV